MRIDARLQVLYLADVGIALFHTGLIGQALLWLRAGLRRESCCGRSGASRASLVDAAPVRAKTTWA